MTASTSSRATLDPRTLLLFVLVCNLTLTTPSHPMLIFVTLTVIGVGLFLFCHPKLALSWTIFVLFWAMLTIVLPRIIKNDLTAYLGLVAFWMFIFSGVFGSAVIAIFGMDLGRLAAVLTSLRAPHWLFVPIMVAVRFIPQAVREFRAITQAMALRGLGKGAQALLHPLKVGEYIVIPFLAAATRTADELAAAATIKGLGSTKQRTSYATSTFGRADLILLLVVLALFGAWIGAKFL